jgi:hypothetical protein
MKTHATSAKFALPDFQARAAAPALHYYAAVLPYASEGIDAIICRVGNLPAIIDRLGDQHCRAAAILTPRLCTKRSMLVEAQTIAKQDPILVSARENILVVNPMIEGVAVGLRFGEVPTMERAQRATSFAAPLTPAAPAPEDLSTEAAPEAAG